MTAAATESGPTATRAPNRVCSLSNLCGPSCVATMWSTSLREQKVMLMLRAYVDESCKVEEHDFVAVAGTMASLKSWQDFESRWTAILKHFGVSALHMRNFAHSRGEFSPWLGDEQKRQDFLGRLMRVALETVDSVVGAVVDVRVFRSLDDAERAVHGNDPYWPCLQDCFSIAGNRAIDFGPDEVVEIFVEAQPGLAAKATDLFDRCKIALADPAMRLDGDPGAIAERLDSITVRSKSGAVPFQVADWLAYEITKEAGSLAMGPQRRPRRWPFDQFMSHRGHIAVYGTKESLLRKSPLGDRL
jgi:hypothetical protein